MKSRRQHLAWCRGRALKYLDGGDVASAILTMNQDLTRHPQTKPSPARVSQALKIVRDDNADEARVWIEGFR